MNKRIELYVNNLSAEFLDFECHMKTEGELGFFVKVERDNYYLRSLTFEFSASNEQEELDMTIKVIALLFRLEIITNGTIKNYKPEIKKM